MGYDQESAYSSSSNAIATVNSIIDPDKQGTKVQYH